MDQLNWGEIAQCDTDLHKLIGSVKYANEVQSIGPGIEKEGAGEKCAMQESGWIGRSGGRMDSEGKGGGAM